MNKLFFNKVVLGGVSSIFGMEEIKIMFNEKGISVRFLETEAMVRHNHIDIDNIEICDKFSMEKTSIFIPLNEYWLSYGHKEGLDRISDRAYRASRSKKYLSGILEEFGMNYCRTLLLSDARREVENGNKVLVKPDSYYSGHGVRVIEKRNVDKLEQYIQEGGILGDEAKRVLMIEEGNTEIWEYIIGEEYSADVFVVGGEQYILRLCRKKIVIIDDTPCVLAYITVPVSSEILNALKNWTDLLFDEDNISFAQFDFIKRENDGEFIPIDFSCRVGGGMKNLFMKYKNNIYKNALETLLTDNVFISNTDTGFYQFNILPVKCGKLYANPYHIPVEDAIIVKDEKTVVNRIGGSANNRLGCIIGENYSEDLFYKMFNMLLIGDGYIKE